MENIAWGRTSLPRGHALLWFRATWNKASKTTRVPHPKESAKQPSSRSANIMTALSGLPRRCIPTCSFEKLPAQWQELFENDAEAKHGSRPIWQYLALLKWNEKVLKEAQNVG